MKNSTVRKVEDLSGVSRTVIHEFVRGATPLEDNLVKLEDWLRRSDIDVDAARAAYLGQSRGSTADLQGKPDADTLRDLWVRLDRIDADPTLTPLQRSIKQERELAAYRASTQDRESRIAEIRARTLERESEFADGRTRALEGGAPFEVIEPLERDESLRELIRQEFQEWTAKMEKTLRGVVQQAS